MTGKNIKDIQYPTKDDYIKAFDEYSKTIDLLFDEINDICKNGIRKNPYMVDLIYEEAQNLCVESLKKSTELLRTLKEETDHMNIKFK